MLSPFFLPVQHFGQKFDKAMTLYEFDAIRQPEAMLFPKIGDFVRKHLRMVEIPKPQIVVRQPMPYRGLKFMPDYFISNDTKAWIYAQAPSRTSLHPSKKHTWGNDVDYEVVSLINHPRGMHEAFEHWCKKVCGFGLGKIVAKYHRAIWLPLYYPESLGQVWPTKFHYPECGYAGALAEILGTSSKAGSMADFVSTECAYILAKTSSRHSVLFVLDDQTPIYRITDQSVCAGAGDGPLLHKLVVEYREQPVSLERDLAEYGYEIKSVAIGKGRIVPPTRANVEAGYDFSNNMNAQLMEYIDAETTASP